MRPHTRGTYRIAVSLEALLLIGHYPARHSYAAARLLPIFFCSAPDFAKRYTYFLAPTPPYLLRFFNSPHPLPFCRTRLFNPFTCRFP
ncbi:hypothetical protein CDAR_472181 [Caerostris darwini]|uniref:Secreted protein n=1 Tax=Caerostris darwini TaxID=1538125 RepID=A0AAV4VML2_9ARAC|nr:hypothetical protein CDAR_472181 [Caerostris darwini]